MSDFDELIRGEVNRQVDIRLREFHESNIKQLMGKEIDIGLKEFREANEKRLEVLADYMRLVNMKMDRFEKGYALTVNDCSRLVVTSGDNSVSIDEDYVKIGKVDETGVTYINIKDIKNVFIAPRGHSGSYSITIYGRVKDEVIREIIYAGGFEANHEFNKLKQFIGR